MRVTAREFKLDQPDRVKKFLARFRELVKDHSLDERARELVTLFEKHGCDEMNKQRFQRLDTDIHNMLISSARSVVKGKQGYSRSPALTQASTFLYFWKSILTSKRNCTSLSRLTIERAGQFEINPVAVSRYSVRRLQTIIRKVRHNLWLKQKESAKLREQ